MTPQFSSTEVFRLYISFPEVTSSDSRLMFAQCHPLSPAPKRHFTPRCLLFNRLCKPFCQPWLGHRILSTKLEQQNVKRSEIRARQAEHLDGRWACSTTPDNACTRSEKRGHGDQEKRRLTSLGSCATHSKPLRVSWLDGRACMRRWAGKPSRILLEVW